MRSLFLARFFLTLVLSLTGWCSSAQNFPSKQLTILVPYAAGADLDTVAGDTADGHTILLGSVATDAIAADIDPKLANEPRFGLWAPKNTPMPIVEGVNASARKALTSPEVRRKLGGQGDLPVGSSVEEFATFARAEYKYWLSFVQSAGIKLQ